jgi:hypothetical protein
VLEYERELMLAFMMMTHPWLEKITIMEKKNKQQER